MSWRLSLDLIDVSFSGPLHPWSNGQDEPDFLMERLDKCHLSHNYLDMFLNARVTHFLLLISDHSAIFFNLSPPIISKKKGRY